MPCCSLRDCLNVNLIRRDRQTSRVVDSSLSSTEVTKALKWIIHFVGDIHQPLHDEALGMHVSKVFLAICSNDSSPDVGGNTIDVTL